MGKKQRKTPKVEDLELYRVKKVPRYPGPGPSPEKKVRSETLPNFMLESPSWRLGWVDLGFPKNWAGEARPILRQMHERLKNLETQKWSEILVQGNESHHFVSVDKITLEARNRLVSRKIFQESLVSLRIDGKKRLWGILDGSSLQLIWWDPHHEICPSPKKHT